MRCSIISRLTIATIALHMLLAFGCKQKDAGASEGDEVNAVSEEMAETPTNAIEDKAKTQTDQKKEPQTENEEQAGADKNAIVKRTFKIKKASSKVRFRMKAPLENIIGKVPSSATGSVEFNLSDLRKSSGKVEIDLDRMTIYQEKRENEEAEFGALEKNEKQNAHARTWFEISEDTPKDVREKNRTVVFSLTGFETDASDIASMAKANATVSTKATAVGTLRLHGKTTSHKEKMELVFKFDAEGQPTSVHVVTKTPFNVSLDKHDIRPRSAFGKLAKVTLGSLGQKVAEKAPVFVEFDAVVQ